MSKKAVKELNEEGVKIGAFLRGYYEIVNQFRRIVEAPTFMIEFDLNGKKVDSEKTIFSYIKHCFLMFSLQLDCILVPCHFLQPMYLLQVLYH